MALNGPFAIYINEQTGQQELRRIQQSGGGNGTTTINTSGGIPVLGIQTAADPNTQVQAVLNRNLLVLIRYATDSNIILPALGDATVGSKITFVRTASPGIPTIVAQVGADQVNGVSTATFTPYVMRSLQDSVTYMRVPNGWQREQGSPAFALVTSAVTPITLAPRPEGTQFVVATIATTGMVTLPAGALCRPGYRVFVLNNGDAELIVAPAGAEQINGDNAQPYYLPVGGSALFELADSAQWVAVEQDESPPPTLNAASALFPVGSWRGFGEQRITLTGVAAQTVQIPSVINLRVGASLFIQNNSVDSALIVPDGAELINGQDRRTILKDRACKLVSNGVGWLAVDGGRYTSPNSSAADPTTIPTWVDSPFFFEDTSAAVAHVINLPALADLQYGAHVLVFNNSAEAGTLTPNGAELINDSGTLAIPANSTAIIYKRDATNWIAVISA